MKHTLTQRSLAVLSGLAALPMRAAAQVFDGGGLNEGISHAKGIAGLAKADVRTMVTNVLLRVLDFLALAAVIFVIIAGFYLVLGSGSDESKEKAKKIILYVIIGIIVILFARVIVMLAISLPT